MDKDLDAACKYLFGRIKERGSDEITIDSLHRTMVQSDLRISEKGLMVGGLQRVVDASLRKSLENAEFGRSEGWDLDWAC